MKTYTDIEQSKKLAEILPLESADMYWLNRHIDLTESKYEVFVINKSNKYIDFFNSYDVAIDNNEIIPCWSLATLLDFLPKSLIYTPNPTLDGYCCKNIMHDLETYGDNAIDACYEMILILKENNLL